MLERALLISNLLLWISVIALAAGYFSLLKRPSSSANEQHDDPTSSLIGQQIGGALPTVASDILERNREVMLLFTLEDCDTCKEVIRQLSSNDNRIDSPLFIIGPVEEGAREIAGYENDPHVGARTRELLGIHLAPYACLVVNGHVTVAGAVSGADDLARMIDYSRV